MVSDSPLSLDWTGLDWSLTTRSRPCDLRQMVHISFRFVAVLIRYAIAENSAGRRTRPVTANLAFDNRSTLGNKVSLHATPLSDRVLNVIRDGLLTPSSLDSSIVIIRSLSDIICRLLEILVTNRRAWSAATKLSADSPMLLPVWHLEKGSEYRPRDIKPFKLHDCD